MSTAPSSSAVGSSSAADTKRCIIEHLKRQGGTTAAELAAALGITPTGVRQHLDGLEAGGLVERSEPVGRGGRGRPAVGWSLTSLAQDLFPDRHADLTVDLIGAIRSAVGDEGLDAVIAARSQKQRSAYRSRVNATPVALRAEQLATIRSAEGYMAEVVPDTDDASAAVLLVEHHCPIRDAATACQGLCRDELETFRELFDGVATVERTSHVVAGDERCTYRITPIPRSPTGKIPASDL